MLAQVLEFTRCIFEEMDPALFRRRFLEALLALQNVERGSLWVRRGEAVVCVEAAGAQSERILGREIPSGTSSVAGWVIANAAMTVAEPGKDPRHFHAAELDLDLKSTLILGFPLTLRDGTVFGAVEIIDTSAGGSRLNLRRDYLELLEGLVAVGSVALGQVLAFDRQARECRGLRQALEDVRAGGLIIGESPAIRASLDKARSYARTEFPVLLTGESGTGKELFARVIHQTGRRCDKPFFVQNCSAIPETLLESELFGYRKGAFTGADKDKAGLFEIAHGGTVFLDEIGDMPPALQAKVLRFVQNSEVKPLGAAASRTVDVRIVSATNRDLQAAIAAGEFREDLYYRLNVLPLELPPLRKRRQDIPMLLEYFLKRERLRLGVDPKRLTAQAVDVLVGLPWRGNIREMENLVKYLLTVVEGDTIDAPDLPGHLAGETPGGRTAPSCPAPGPAGTWEEAERAYALDLLERTRWNVAKAARLAGVNRTTFDSRLKRLGIAKQ